MHSPHWQEIERLFARLTTMSPAQHAAFMANECEQDPELRRELESLLAAHAASGPLDSAPEWSSDGADAPPPGDSNTVVAPGVAPGSRVGLYVLQSSIAAGGMGEVWLAERADGLVRRKVALKLPHWSWVRPELAERMTREREILAGLEHPNIARLYDAGVDALGRPYLAMEYVEGRPIDAYCRDRQLSIRECLQLVLQVARAVAHAHARLIVHRELKPSNILVASDGTVRLLDFGIAKVLENERGQETRLTQAAGRMLTPEYASPEQIKGEAIGTATDVYSLAIVTYELLAGAKPYRLKRQSAAELEEAIAALEPLSASEAAQDRARGRQLRGDVDAILNKAMKKDPAQRYASVEAFAQDIERHIAGQAVLARPDSKLYQLGKFAKRHRVALGASTAIAVALIVAATVSLQQAAAARREAVRAEQQAARAEQVKRFV